MIELLDNLLMLSEAPAKAEAEAEFDSIFQPISAEELADRQGWVKNSDGTYDCGGDVNLPNMKLDRLPVKFGVVGGNFDCSFNCLTTLEGAPQEVGGRFFCGNNQLTSLAGAPRVVGGYFDCDNNRLTTLAGGPREVGGDFGCGGNRLTTLEGAPQKVGGDFYYLGNPTSEIKLKKTVERDYL